MPGSINDTVAATGQPVAVELSESMRTRYSVVAALAITEQKRTKHGASARTKRVIIGPLRLVGPGTAVRDDTTLRRNGRKKESTSGFNGGSPGREKDTVPGRHRRRHPSK